MDRSRAISNPGADGGPVKEQMTTEVVDWHRVWASTADFLPYPRHVGVQTAGYFFNGEKIVGIEQWRGIR